MKKTEKRLITLSDGTGMGGELLVFRTDAPAEVLSENILRDFYQRS